MLPAVRRNEAFVFKFFLMVLKLSITSHMLLATLFAILDGYMARVYFLGRLRLPHVSDVVG